MASFIRALTDALPLLVASAVVVWFVAKRKERGWADWLRVWTLFAVLTAMLLGMLTMIDHGHQGARQRAIQQQPPIDPGTAAVPATGRDEE
ncbi:MAG: hypothetical protein AAGI68_14665 [Planctomycetota bacterium]